MLKGKKQKEKEIEDETSKIAKLQSVVTDAFGCENGVFQKSVELALEKWDPQLPFIVLELGCGGGHNAVFLIEKLKLLVRSKNKNANIKVFQMDYEPQSEKDKKERFKSLKLNSEKWIDTGCESYFMGQTFYDKYNFQSAINIIKGDKEEKIKVDKDLKINLIFSQSSLHWVKDMQKLSMKHFRSEKTREYSNKSMSVIFDRMEEKLAVGGVTSATCLGIIGNKGWENFENTVSRYTSTFQAILNKEDCEKMLSEFLPQIPRRMEDMKKDVDSRKSLEWILSGKLGGVVPKMKINDDLAKLYAKGMLSPTMWKDRFIKLFPKKDVESTFKKGEVEMGKAIKQNGIGTYNIIYFVLRKM